MHIDYWQHIGHFKAFREMRELHDSKISIMASAGFDVVYFAIMGWGGGGKGVVVGGGGALPCTENSRVVLMPTLSSLPTF